MLFDTHAHLNDPAFDEDRAELLETFKDAGVGLVLNAGCSLESSRDCIALTEQYPWIYCSVGTHPDTADEVNEEVLEAYKKQLEYFVKWHAIHINSFEYIGREDLPLPVVSATMEGCMENGKDCTAGGCKYNAYGGTATGLATLADAISTIKYMCFDKKILTTRELYDAWIANWEGYEPLRQRILNEVPHYGNADPYVDQELKWCVDLYYKICQEMHSNRSKVYKCGLYGASDMSRKHSSNITLDAVVSTKKGKKKVSDE